MTENIRVAFGSVPKDSGTFTFYRNQRPELLLQGIDMRCVSIGAHQGALWDKRYADDGCVLLAPHSRNLKRQARVFADWCEAEGIDIVIAVNSGPILSALPHLPEQIRVVSRCANAFEHGYRIAMSGSDRLSRIVALSPRLRDDLVADYGADPEKLVLIPNGIDPAPFEAPAAITRGANETLTIGFLGRLEHNQKGVLHLPAIARAIAERGVRFNLRIAGDGRHEIRLRKELSAEVKAGIVSFEGRIGPEEVPGFLASCDIFAFTSRFEGVPNALLEALMAGCIPVSFLIEGITDFVIEDGESGMIVGQEDIDGFAGAVEALAANRMRLAAMGKAASRFARDRFTASGCAEAYGAMFRKVMADAPPAWDPKPWNDFVPDPNFPQSWRQYLPVGLENVIKKLRSRASGN